MAVSTRAPREGDDTDTWLRTVGLATISIHVPCEGDDYRTFSYVARYVLFQSTSPVRGTTQHWIYPPVTRRFQSTSPVRGTTEALARGGSRYEISIHVPREGDDRPLSGRSPPGSDISIHVPREGDDIDR